MANIVTQASELILKMDNDQLNEVVESIKLKRQFISREAVRGFRVGDLVEFNRRKNSGLVQGKITKVNRKNINVLSNAGTPWRVSATLLRPMELHIGEDVS
tara:strand:+ start:509 stop:811 length:303 start_codon:yes stop_codon:yes gene_type:complete